MIPTKNRYSCLSDFPDFDKNKTEDEQSEQATAGSGLPSSKQRSAMKTQPAEETAEKRLPAKKRPPAKLINAMNTLLKVVVDIAGQPTTACYDGGAEISLIRKSEFDRLPKEVVGKRLKSPRLMDVQQNDIKSYGTHHLKINAAGTMLSNKFTIVDKLSTPLLLGRDFCAEHDVTVSHRGPRFWIGGQELPVATSAPKQAPQATFSFTLAKKKTCIPPKSIQLVRVRSTTTLPDTELLLGSPQGRSELAFSQLVTTNNSEALIQLQNVSEKPLVLRAESTLALGTPLNKNARLVNAVHVNNVNKEAKKSQVEAEEQLRPFDPSKEEDVAIMENLKNVHIGPLVDNEEKKKKVMGLLWRHRHVFSTGPWDLGLCTLPEAEHKMRLKPGSKPVKSKPYRPCLADKEEMDKHVKAMRTANLVHPSTSAYGSPMYLIRKVKEANGQTKTYKRIIINMKAVNEQLEGTAQYLPRMDDILDNFAGKKVYSSIDLTQFYFQLPLAKESQPICAFSTPSGLYEPTRVAMGDATAPNHAQTVITKVLEGVEDTGVLLDDIGIGTITFSGMLGTLAKVFGRVSSAGLKLKPSKCFLFQAKLEFLGHTIKDGNIHQSEDKIEKVKAWPRPQTAKEIAGFLGFLGFWRQFLKDLSAKSKPLLDLQKQCPKGKFKKGQWTESHEKSFQGLKELAVTAPFLHIFEPGKGQAHLYVDASETALGACLAQEVTLESGRTVQQPVAFASRLYRGAEQRYSINDKEGLAAVWAIRKFRVYLLGSPFSLHTDSQTVYHMLKTDACDLSKRLGRFAALVSAYSFKVYLIKGEKNLVADALSRLPTVLDKATGELTYRQDEELCFEKESNDDNIDVDIDDKDDPEAVVAAVTRMQAKLEGYDNVREEQRKDEELQQIITALRRNDNEPIHEGQIKYHMKNGYLWITDTLSRERIVIPKKMISSLLHDRHSMPQTGHPGSVKLYQDLSSKFYWRGMKEDIEDYVKKCDVCQRTKTNYRHVRPPMSHLPRPTRGWEVMACDIMGPFRGARQKYVFVIVDLFTRYAWAKALTVQSGKNIADFLVEQVFPFGRPTTLLSDNAGNLDAGIVAELLAMNAIQKKRSTPMHPASNGAIERLVGSIGNMIRLAVETEPKAWPDYLPQLVNQYNQSYHRAVKEKPVVLAFGVEPEDVDRLFPAEYKAFTNPSAYAKSLMERKAKAAEVALKALKSYYKKSKKNFDDKNKTKPHSFSPGDWVLVKIIHVNPVEGKKIGARYYGPAEVLEVDDHTAKIQFIANGYIRRRNVEHLRPYFYDEEQLPELAARFTAPKRRNKRFDKKSSTTVTDEEVDTVGDLVQGMAPGSPFAHLVDAPGSQDVPESPGLDEDDDEEAPRPEGGVTKAVRFSNEDAVHMIKLFCTA